MGFGLLLIGYIFAYVLTIGLGNYLFAGMLIGGFIMFLGLCELRKYCPSFLYAIIANVLFLFCSFYESLSWAEPLLGLPLGLSSLSSFFNWAELLISLAFNIALLYSIADLSIMVDYPDTRHKSYRNMIFVGVFNIMQLLMLIPNSIFKLEEGFFMVLLMILQIIYTVFNAILIFKCYAMICPEGEEDMKRKPSRFAFINKMREKQDEREQQAIENTKAYIENKIKKKNEAKELKDNNKKHKKKK